MKTHAWHFKWLEIKIKYPEIFYVVSWLELQTRLKSESFVSSCYGDVLSQKSFFFVWTFFIVFKAVYKLKLFLFGLLFIDTLLRFLGCFKFFISFRTNIEFVSWLTMFEQVAPCWVLCIALDHWAVVRKISCVQANVNLMGKNCDYCGCLSRQ